MRLLYVVLFLFIGVCQAQDWEQVGQTLNATPSDRFNEFSMDISQDGNVIAINRGNPGVYPEVQVYEFSNNQWITKGQLLTFGDTGAECDALGGGGSMNDCELSQAYSTPQDEVTGYLVFNSEFADDIDVDANTDFSLETLKVSYFSNALPPIETLTIRFYTDNNGEPGNLLSEYDNIQVIDFEIYVVDGPAESVTIYEFDLTSINTTLSGGTSGEKYWISFFNPDGSTNNNSQILSTKNIINGIELKYRQGTGNWTIINPASAKDSTYQLFGECTISQSGLTFVPDDNFENYLETHDANGNEVALGAANSMGNGIANDDYVFTDRITPVINLQVNTVGIADLTGIEDFISLEVLNCSQNNLTNLNLSENVNLRELYSFFNLMNTVDLTGNTLLRILRLDNNQLPSIDLSQNSLLEEINLDANSIGILNVANMNNLTRLQASQNSFTSLNLSNSVNLDYLTLSNSVLENLDLSQNALLQIFDISNCDSLETVDLRNGGNTNITLYNSIGSENLTCVFVDDSTYSENNWTAVDPATTFIETQQECDNLGGGNPDQTFVPDDNFETRLQQLGYDSGPLDDYVLTANISGITSLNLFNRGIADPTGIEDFISLQTLDFHANDITFLDTSTLADLEILDCSINEITSLTVNQNTQLINLNAGSNELTDLDLTANILLTDLIITNNTISQIDINNNINLINLNAENNGLTSLDISNNTQLELLGLNSNLLQDLDTSNNNELRTLFAGSNNISSFDFSNNTSLVSLNCQDNPIFFIDLSLNVNLETLVANFIEAQSIDLSNNVNLTAFVLGASTSLSYVNVQNGNNTNVTGLSISNAPSLECVVVDDVNYSNNNWSASVDPQITFSTDANSCGQITCQPPQVDMLSNVSACDEYILPVLNNGDYFTQTGGTGTMLNAGESVSTNQTIFIYAENSSDSTCNNESSFTVNINETPQVDVLQDVSACNSYTLQALNTGNYFTQSGGTGTQLNSGDVVSASQTLFIYAENMSDSSCSDESSFSITIGGPPPVDTLTNVTECESYTLQSLNNGDYFTQSGGTGTALNAGDAITSTQTIFIYAEDPNDSTCNNESSFTVTIQPLSPVDMLSDVSTCTSYTLPNLNNGNYYSETNEGGTPYGPGDVISTSQTIFIYNNDTGCENESSFTITIGQPPLVDMLSDVSSCNSYTLQPLNNGDYFTQSGGTGTQLSAGDVIPTSQTLFIYAEDANDATCNNESTFTITIQQAPNVDTLNDVSECDSYTLPTITNGNYFTQSGGMGIALNAGDIISTSQTLFIYAEDANDPTCNNESDFTVTIFNVDIILAEENLTINESTLTVSLPSINGVSYEYAVDSGAFQESNVFVGLSFGQHTLTVRDTNECDLETITFQIEGAEISEIPSFFSPNGDGFNDVWLVADDQLKIKEIAIYDRFGKLLKFINGNTKFWDGTYNGVNLPSSDYWYLISYKDGRQTTGHFSLIR